MNLNLCLAKTTSLSQVMKISCSEFNVFVFTNCARQSVNTGTAGLLSAVEVACALPCDDEPFDDAQGSSIHLEDR